MKLRNECSQQGSISLHLIQYSPWDPVQTVSKLCERVNDLKISYVKNMIIYIIKLKKTQ